MQNIEIWVTNKGRMQSPLTAEGVSWETERKGSPGVLRFSVLKDAGLDFTEGNPVQMLVDGVPLFFGFVFSKKRDRDGVIDVIAYDQLRYFKNKETMVYQNKTAGEVLSMLSKDHGLQVGEVGGTAYRIPYRVEENKTMFDIMLGAMEEHLTHTGELLVLYDEAGKLHLKPLGSLRVPLVVTDVSASNYSYTSNIENSYDRIKIDRKNEESGLYEPYILQHGENINRWGVLQYHEIAKDGEDIQTKLATLLKLHNEKRRALSVSDVFGDIRVRAGCLVLVSLHLGDIVQNAWMLVEKCKHVFEHGAHFMNLTLRGGEFVE